MLYSHSRLETFDSCRLKFKYQYIDKPDIPKRDSVEAFLGIRVHETLEALYKNLMMGKTWTCEEYLQHYQDNWQRNQSDAIFIVKKEYSLEDYFQQGLAALEKYWKHYQPFDQEKTIDLERRVYFSLDDGGRFQMQGFIDRLSKTENGVWQIRDYKTKRRLPTQQEADADRQLALYQIGIERMWPEIEQIELIWHYVLFNEEIKSVRDHTDLERVKLDTIHLIQEVERAVAADDFPYKESALCDWCDYFDICPAKKHLAKVRQLPPREFKEEEGVQLVDRFSQLKRQEKEVKAELEALKEGLIAFADQFQADRIYGSDQRVKIISKDTYKVPSTDDKHRRSLLVELLKEAGFWESVSNFYGPRLVKMYEKDQLPADLKAKITEFLTPATIQTIRLSKAETYDENFEDI
ncbi:MAG: PD-(D/E)XK nuclease family protein [candidate division Zixibacteria bacterium]|nr:PD-(D/E)XK nuclease family protein [candidate division Zixibacteria bacterium]